MSRNTMSRPKPFSVMKRAPLLFKLFFGFVMAAVLAGFITVIFINVGGMTVTAEQSNCTVTNTSHTLTEDGDMYRVFTSCGAFNVQGDILNGELSGVGMFNNIEEGKTYNFTVRGFTNQNFGIVPNIIKMELVS